MRRPSVRVVFAALIAAAILAAPAATLSASCCAPAVDVTVAAPSCCGCDGRVSRPAPVDRAALESRRAPLLPVVASSPNCLDPISWTAVPLTTARSPIPVVPASPFPRRL